MVISVLFVMTGTELDDIKLACLFSDCCAR